jgi:hypothetical protein
MRANVFVAAATVLAAACGGTKSESQPETKAEAKADSAATPAPAQTMAADTLNPPKADSAAKQQAAGPLRDSAFGPKYQVDEKTGKVTPIKKTP